MDKFYDINSANTNSENEEAKDNKISTPPKSPSRRIAEGAVIAVLYVVLTILFAPISFSAVQVRVAEALSILPLFTASAVPGLFIGCLIANILGGGILPDIIVGSLATLIGAAGGYLLRKNRWLVPIPSILANTVLIPPVLRYGYGVNMPILLIAVYIAIGEIIGCYVLGELLATILLPYRFRIFAE